MTSTDHYMRRMGRDSRERREVCPSHESSLEVCDCRCTCGGPAGSCSGNPQCRLPDIQPKGFIRRRTR